MAIISNDESDFNVAKVGALLLTDGQTELKNEDIEVIYSENIRLNEPPNKPIIKMAQKEYVNKFFETGEIKLGTFKEYQISENSEVRDEMEGQFVIIGITPSEKCLIQLSGGDNHLVFCTSLGEFDNGCAEKFNYDYGYIITNPQSFASEVQKTINANNYNFGKCEYTNYKVIFGKVEEGYNIRRGSAKSIDMIGKGKYFIKPKAYLHQDEFRFIWEMNEDIANFPIIYCPEAVKYCKRM